MQIEHFWLNNTEKRMKHLDAYSTKSWEVSDWLRAKDKNYPASLKGSPTYFKNTLLNYQPIKSMLPVISGPFIFFSAEISRVGVKLTPTPQRWNSYSSINMRHILSKS